MYAFTALYFYKVIFTLELFVAECIVCRGMKRRRHFVLRLAVAFVLCIGSAFALPILAYNALYCSLIFLLLFAISMLGIWFCYLENAVSILFRAIAAYTAQHIAYQIFDLISLGIGLIFSQYVGPTGAYGDGEIISSLQDIFNLIMNPGSAALGAVTASLSLLLTAVAYIFTYTITYYISGLFVCNKLKDSNKFELRNSVLLVFITLFMLFNIVVSSLVTYYSGGEKFDLFYVVLLGLYNVGASFFTLYIMIERVYRIQLERNYRASERMRRQSEAQYFLAKRNVELINMKCHDMKHQIHSLAGIQMSASARKEIDDIISVYDANIRTGNEALDIILTEKSLYCQKHAIKLYCIVDGKLLHFIADADLYSLFGNILDNAIEAVRSLEKKRRYINLAVRMVNGFVCVTESNCHDNELSFVDGLPKTTKADKDMHGYGMKSIRHICKKYNAELAVSAKDGKFELNIIFME